MEEKGRLDYLCFYLPPNGFTISLLFFFSRGEKGGSAEYQERKNGPGEKKGLSRKEATQCTKTHLAFPILFSNVFAMWMCT